MTFDALGDFDIGTHCNSNVTPRRWGDLEGASDPEVRIYAQPRTIYTIHSIYQHYVNEGTLRTCGMMRIRLEEIGAAPRRTANCLFRRCGGAPARSRQFVGARLGGHLRLANGDALFR